MDHDVRGVIRQFSPWHQRIELAPGVFTTDAPGSWVADAEWDNAVDGLSVEVAARLRPEPKWNYIQQFLPDLHGMKLIEIGSNCGFFSFKFAKTRSFVTGINISDD